MRLVIKLKSNRTVSQKEFMAKYYSSMNGYIYNLLSSQKELSLLHEQKSFKGFCFSSIYPVKDRLIKENEVYTLVISSPMPKIIEHLFFNIKEGSLINLGEGSFTVVGVEVRSFAFNNSDRLEVVSIINLVSSETSKSLLFEKEPKKYIEQLKINLLKKYNLLRKKEVSLDFNLFENVKIKQIRIKKDLKPYAIPLLFDENKKFNVFGEKFSFKFNKITDEQLAIFQICFDAGFGERNSFGMGFMMVRK